MSDLFSEAAGQDSKKQGPNELALVQGLVMGLPDGSRILQCIQCGTCGGACPVSFAMDRTPRQVINLVRSGRVDEALRSETIWLCASCYNCTIQCPAGIKITEVMYALKVVSTELGIHYKGAFGPVFTRAFVRQLESIGRISEVRLMTRAFAHKPRLFLTIGPASYLKLLRAGRLKFRTERVKGMDQLRKMNDWLAVSGFSLGGKTRI
jgi:heterodisulfide reductase subunit C